MKPNFSIRVPKSIWCISLFLLVSCKDDPEPVIKAAPSGYSFVSIEYTLLKASEQQVSTREFPCENNSDNSVVNILRVDDHAPLNSVFSKPDEPLEYPDLIGRIMVPVPRLDAAGTIVGLSDLTLFLRFDDEPAGAVFVTYAPSIIIPALTNYTLSTHFEGWRITARYTCTVENNDTKEHIVFSGILNSDAFYGLEIDFTDAQNNTVDTIKQAVDY